MNNFDPFISSEYKTYTQDQNDMIEGIQNTEKYQSEFINNLLTDSRIEITIGGNFEKIPIMQKKQTNQMAIQQSGSGSDSEGSKNSKKSNSKTSPFHNFQKHLVITLRQLLSFQHLEIKSQLEYHIASEIFNIFKKSSKTSRIFLEQIFGIYQAKDMKCIEKKQNALRLGELKQLAEKYQIDQILRAQDILRYLIKQKLEDCNLSQNLNQRKIQKKIQFIEYFNLFKTELQFGKQRKKAYKQLANGFQTGPSQN